MKPSYFTSDDLNDDVEASAESDSSSDEEEVAPVAKSTTDTLFKEIEVCP